VRKGFHSFNTPENIRSDREFNAAMNKVVRKFNEPTPQTSWQPLKDRVLIERLPEPERLITLTDAEKYRKFRVLAVGPKCFEVSKGDIVVLPGVAANEPDFDFGKQQLLVMEADIGWKIGEERTNS
jgi:co-chaperonin GroES (HSP10)